MIRGLRPKEVVTYSQPVCKQRARGGGIPVRDLRAGVQEAADVRRTSADETGTEAPARDLRRCQPLEESRGIYTTRVSPRVVFALRDTRELRTFTNLKCNGCDSTQATHQSIRGTVRAVDHGLTCIALPQIEFIIKQHENVNTGVLSSRMRRPRLLLARI